MKNVYELEMEVVKMDKQKREMENVISLIEDLVMSIKELPSSKERELLIDNLSEEKFTLEDELDDLKNELEELSIVLFEIQQQEQEALEKEYYESLF